MSETIRPHEMKETKEKGANVKIILKFIRHGERDSEGNLQDYGRDITRKKARERGFKKEDFDAVKAYGSTAGPKVEIEGEIDMARSTETAHIYGKEIADEGIYKTRPRKELSYETLVTPPPYDHRAIYDSFIPENFDEMTDEEKIAAAKEANKKTIDYFIGLKTEEAEQHKKEVAGAFAYIIEHTSRKTQRLDSGSTILEPEGSHGGSMELILQYAMVREDDEGNQTIGFETLDEIGGDFDPSEAFNVVVETDENGELKDYVLTFDDTEKRPGGKIYLDKDKVRELAEFYRELHKKEPSE